MCISGMHNLLVGGKTYGPDEKTALDAKAQSALGMLLLDLVRHLSLA